MLWTAGVRVLFRSYELGIQCEFRSQEPKNRFENSFLHVLDPTWVFKYILSLILRYYTKGSRIPWSGTGTALGRKRNPTSNRKKKKFRCGSWGSREPFVSYLKMKERNMSKHSSGLNKAWERTFKCVSANKILSVCRDSSNETKPCHPCCKHGIGFVSYWHISIHSKSHQNR